MKRFTFRLHVHCLDEPRGYIWTVKIRGRRGELHAKWVMVRGPLATMGPMIRQPRAYLVGRAHRLTRLKGGIILT